eukprot:TRINITY_DN1262_c0_g1_i8.p1 TRINITY_DN1262_c0_g1~~TRINITY_DN1262_c0_g1_i8.p1  ORF type:complete len:573 (+),score=128.96 TRINITY_DN1262_c0_g1_i8:984-2702(+)
MASEFDLRFINDPIHGYISIPDETRCFIDTPQFQRLRDLKQLGACYYVFPGASHNRFEHSIGTMHLAEEMLRSRQEYQPELRITDREIFLVKTAGLCHDLGHGPFSHVFDNQFMPIARPGSKWKHEQASTMMLDHLIDENNIDIERAELRMLHELINPSDNPIPGQGDQRRFLYDIVSNSRNSVDVDKFDYLQRDCYNLGIKSSYDPKRLMRYCRVIDDEICFHHKEAYNLYELFHTRYSLFKQVYTHHVGKAIEFMICDALVEADSELEISSAVEDAESYMNLTDSILKTIESSRSPSLQKARDIIMRIRKRHLYKMVDKIVIPSSSWHIVRQVQAADIVNCQSGNLLRPEDIHIDIMTINYAFKDLNPVDHVKFFSPSNPNSKFSIPKEKVSSLIPSTFQERALRVYIKDVQPHKVEALVNAIQEYARRHLPSDVVVEGLSKCTASPQSVGYDEEKRPTRAPRRTTSNGSVTSVGSFSQDATPSFSPCPSKRRKLGHEPRSSKDLSSRFMDRDIPSFPSSASSTSSSSSSSSSISSSSASSTSGSPARLRSFVAQLPVYPEAGGDTDEDM